MLWSIISWIIVGGIAGWIASMIMKKNAQMGFVANVASGIIGAFVVGFLVSFFTEGGGMPDAWSIWGFVAAIIGACLLIWIVTAIRGRSKV
ncbi:GlsB/YeaQ/YmgE family stress response membrane protein [Dietzia aerolata]|uniref:GlsB/YeaQ/YmgE family stress response membrane protein n=1 Tax=Dietzia aerolata TaxID=595984 RepID=A0ABV5JVC8_9ACTN|nr:GlsB/YeaQ/YmgE family stress response membrane protein [Dietzia aerolata]MBB0967786.1 GlsB/YeaQ/YmgE family stress response membrane protein [Dietzia aerolata]HIW69511.1 GlsB/YeaQ/YmgE family stress response membrane protein [Candidatus Dietzia merdigallinarum]